MDRGSVWLGVAGLVVKDDKILTVKKSYSKTKGLWTFPGGFVQPGETLDEAVLRELKEETQIDANIVGIIGARTGVLRTGVGDHLILFYLEYVSGVPHPQQGEIDEVRFMTKEELLQDPNTNEFMLETLQKFNPKRKRLEKLEKMPKRDYGYQSYKIFC
ncbi:NUDIX domain-containing protein [Tepidibacillus marianensis]|uniref:NUDIX hydrolase n=1 Tax=Tepidibacillus marianensis TaxID=3131995 RepID=UPI0030CD51DB